MADKEGGFWRSSFVCGRLCVTTTTQAANAPFIDRASTRDKHNRRYEGWAILLHPWWRNKYGETIPQTAFVLAWRKGES